MKLKREDHEWEPCVNMGSEPTIDLDIEDSIGYMALVELTREDLENMLSALDDLEATDVYAKENTRERSQRTYTH